MQLKITDVKIWLYPKPIDLRKGIDGLSATVIQQQLPLQEGIFVFHNGARDKIKLLAWHRNGFILLHKRLERGKFIFTRHTNDTYVIEEKQLAWLLAGLDWIQMSRCPELAFDDFF